jgi:hypothetical protein
MHFIKEVTGLKGFKTKTITRTPRGMMARSVLLIAVLSLENGLR